MNAAQILLYVQRKWPNALQSPVAQACRAETAEEFPLQDAIEHAERCLEAADGWEIDTLSHNIESSFPELDREQCDDIAEAVLAEQVAA